MLELGIDLDVWPWVWLGIAIAFALIELTFIAETFIILPWAVSAFVAAILAFYDVSVEVQWSVFVFGGGVLFVAMYQWAQRFMKTHTMEPGVGADRLVGMVGLVLQSIEPDDTDRKGRVSIAGEVWGALVDGSEPVPAGARVKVLAMKGTRVIVAPELSGTVPDGREKT